uniref:hypothetical protein n=1 Tax=Kitasatospora indigofera TaxID=67307 RepID=UPI002F906DE5
MTSEAPPRIDDTSDRAVLVPLCGWCQAPLPPAPKGRPRAYCDLSCKSKAARRRLAERPKPPAPAAPAGLAAAAPALPPGVLAAAAEDAPPGPRRRVLELADALAGAAYFFARTVDDGDPTLALTRLRTAVPRFAAQLLEAAQAAHDDVRADRAPRPAAHLDADPAHLDGLAPDLDDPSISPGPADGTTTAAAAPGPGPAPSPGRIRIASKGGRRRPRLNWRRPGAS